MNDRASVKGIGLQVGGSHYDDLAIKPWDLESSYDLGGTELLIVKYVTRWPSKGGIEDLRKAFHCAEKILRDIDLIGPCRGLAKPRPMHISAFRYCQENRLGLYESVVVENVCNFEVLGFEKHMRTARNALLELIHVERIEQGLGPGE